MLQSWMAKRELGKVSNMKLLSAAHLQVFYEKLKSQFHCFSLSSSLLFVDSESLQKLLRSHS